MNNFTSKSYWYNVKHSHGIEVSNSMCGGVTNSLTNAVALNPYNTEEEINDRFSNTIKGEENKENENEGDNIKETENNGDKGNDGENNEANIGEEEDNANKEIKEGNEEIKREETAPETHPTENMKETEE